MKEKTHFEVVCEGGRRWFRQEPRHRNKRRSAFQKDIAEKTKQSINTLGKSSLSCYLFSFNLIFTTLSTPSKRKVCLYSMCIHPCMHVHRHAGNHVHHNINVFIIIRRWDTRSSFVLRVYRQAWF